MSTKAIRWCLTADLTLSAPEQLILILIAHHFSEDSKCCWPSHVLLTRESKLSASTVDKALTSLDQKGLIARTRGNAYRSTRYTLPRYVALLKQKKEEGVPLHTGYPATEGTPTEEGGTPPHGVGTPPHGVEQTSNNHKKQQPVSAHGGKPHDAHTPQSEQEQEPITMKVADIQQGAKEKYANMTEADILKVKKVKGMIPAAELAQVWRRAHGKWSSGVFLHALTVKETGQFATAYKRAGDLVPAAMVAALKDWPGFISHTKEQAGFKNAPAVPTVSFFVQNIEHAVSWLGKGEEAVEDWTPKAKPVQSIAKPAVNPEPEAPAKLTLDDLNEVFSEVEGEAP